MRSHGPRLLNKHLRNSSLPRAPYRCWAYLIFFADFDVTTDASGTAVGDVLSQRYHPLAFFSKKIYPCTQLASAYDREMFAITEAVKKWRQYLLGCHFWIFTDQCNIRSLLSQTIQTPSQQKWLTKLVGFDYEILYTPRRINVVADGLSWSPPPSEAMFCALSSCQPILLDQLRNFYTSHHVSQMLIQKFLNSTTPSDFSSQQGILHYKGHLFVPAET